MEFITGTDEIRIVQRGRPYDKWDRDIEDTAGTEWKLPNVGKRNVRNILCNGSKSVKGKIHAVKMKRG